MAAEWAGLEQVGIFPTKYSYSGPPRLSFCSTLKNCRRWLGARSRQSMPEALDSALSVPILSSSHICLLADFILPFLPWSFSQALKVVRQSPGFG